MRKRILTFILAFVLLFTSLSPQLVYASELGEEDNSVMFLADTSGDIEDLRNEAILAVSTMTGTALATLYKVVGSIAFGSLALSGIVYDKLTADTGVQVLGARIVGGLHDLHLTKLLKTVASIVLTISQDKNYFDKNDLTVDNETFQQAGEYLKDEIGAETVELDVVFNSQTVIPNEILSKMSSDIYNTYSNYGKALFVNSGNMYMIYGLPSSAYYVLLHTNGHISFYKYTGEQVTEATYLTYNSDSEDWTYRPSGTPYFLGGEYGNTIYAPYLSVKSGATYDSSEPVTTTTALTLNKTGQKDEPDVITNTFSGSYQELIDVGTGDTTFADSGVQVESGTSSSSSSVIKNIFEVVQNIYNVIANLAQSIANAIQKVLEKVFIPSDASVQEIKDLIDVKLPVIGDLGNWSDNVANVIGNPEEYSSTLEFNVDMSKADTYWNYGGSKTNMINLNWYFKYKNQVDSIIVGIAWLVFLWNLYGQLPNIISAVGSGVYLNTRNSSINNSNNSFKKVKGD